MDKQIHFYESNEEMNRDSFYMVQQFRSIDICRDRLHTLNAICENTECIMTTDLASLTSKLFDKNYRIFLNQRDCRFIEIKIGNNDWTLKDIRKSHNFLKMYIAGAMRCENGEEY